MQNELRLYCEEIPNFIRELNYWKHSCSGQVVSCGAYTQYKMVPSR